jgi:hypothetical protein
MNHLGVLQIADQGLTVAGDDLAFSQRFESYSIAQSFRSDECGRLNHEIEHGTPLIGVS